MSAFLRSFRSEHCRDFENNNAVFFNVEIAKTLLLYGEMDALLRVCAHPETHLKESFERGTCWECGVSPDFETSYHLGSAMPIGKS